MKRQLPKILEKYLGLKKKITKELILDPNEEDEMGRKRGEGKREYNHKLTLYRHALNEINQNRKIEKTIKAAESGHTKAMMSLYNFYKEDDKELSFNWLRLAVDNKNKKAIEIYKEVKKEEKDFKKKQKEEYALRTKKIRNLLSKNPNDLKAILELAINDDKDAIALIERCYKYAPLSKEEEEIFNQFSSSYYIKYLIALTYKDIDKEKYVTLITKLYDENKMPELANEFNENKSLIFDDPKTCKIVEDIARGSNNVYIKKLVISGHQEVNSDSIEFLFMLCENKNIKAVKSIIEYYIEHNKDIDNKYIEAIIRYDDLNEKTDHKIIIDFAIAKLYKYNFITSTKNKILSPNTAFLLIEKATNLENEPIIIKDANYELSDCYINGYGVEKDLYKASKCLEKYDLSKAKELLYKHNYLKGQERVRNFFEKYKCKEFDYFSVTNKEKADKIIRRYANFNDESIIETLKRRDYLLSIGLTINEIFDDTGYLSESRIASKVKVIEDEIKRKKEEEIRIQQEKKKKELEKEKQSKESIKPTTSSVNITSIRRNETFTLPFKGDITEDMYAKFYKELLPFNCCNRSIMDECVRIAKLRVAYNYPICPTKAGISQRKFEKLYAEYNQDIERYIERLCEIKNPIIGRENEHRLKVYGFASSDNFINLTEFNNLIKSKLSDISSIKVSKVDIADREHKTIGANTQIERMLCLLPLFAINVKLDIYLDISYDSVSSHKYLDWVEAFENSEYSKIMDWSDFSSDKSGYWYDIHIASEKDRYAQENANSRKRMDMEKALSYKILEELKKYKIFYRYNWKKNGKSAYIEALVKKVTPCFHFSEKK